MWAGASGRTGESLSAVSVGEFGGDSQLHLCQLGFQELRYVAALFEETTLNVSD